MLHLGAGEVLDEVLKLLARLELDRQTTYEKLKREKCRVAELQNRVDRLALARIITFPSIIQKGKEKRHAIRLEFMHIHGVINIAKFM